MTRAAALRCIVKMKTKILAIVILISVIGFSAFNSYFLHNEIISFTEKIEALEINENNTDKTLVSALEIKAWFRARESYISLSVNHEDLSNIETIFAELLGELEVGRADEATVAKSRLIDALHHLGRLSGVNIDTII